MELAVGTEFSEDLTRDDDTLDRDAEMDGFLRGVERRAYAIVRVSVRDADEALDIVQEAMIRLVRRYAARPRAEWAPLFYRILQNAVRDWQRRRIVRDRVLSFFGSSGSGESDPIESAAALGEDPVAQLAGTAAMDALASGLRSLPDRQREAFMLRAFEGLDVAQTAQAMGCSQGSVKTHYSRAVSRLRELLGEHEP
jgi:RNA polymerase sigma-70 factor (ECF subfamily)